MSRRKVTRTSKDRDGDILALCNPAEYWLQTPKATAIREIETGTHSYYTEAAGKVADVYVKAGPRGKYLTTSADGRGSNNLDLLPDC